MNSYKTTVERPLKEGHLPELDGIRGIAILMVMIGHGYRIGAELAVPGVGLFFVLSGFLITRILISSAGKPHFFTNFYTRRALRIWPLYFLILAIAYLTPVFVFSHAQFPAYRFFLYIQNFWSLNGAPPILGTTWSLAIEEQFYLVWPLLVWLLQSHRRVGWAAVFLIAVAPLSRILIYWSGADPYAMTLGRLDGLATGAALAVLTIVFPHDCKHVRLILSICFGIGVLLLPSLHFILWRKAFKDTSTSLFFGCVIAVAFYRQGTRLTAALRNSILRFFGKISYCAYLIHLSLVYAIRPTALALAIAVIVATFSWYVFENPILQLKNRLTRVDPAATPAIS